FPGLAAFATTPRGTHDVRATLAPGRSGGGLGAGFGDHSGPLGVATGQASEKHALSGWLETGSPAGGVPSGVLVRSQGRPERKWGLRHHGLQLRRTAWLG